VQRKIVVFLIVVAILVYGWNAISFFKPNFQTAKSTKAPVAEQSAPLAVYIPETVTFSPVSRSPFEGTIRHVSVARSPKRAMTTTKKASTTAPVTSPTRVQSNPVPTPVAQSQTVEAPRIVINGIMWNSTRPLAMIKLPDGSEQMVKPGDNIMGRIDIKQIERNRVQVLYKDQLFWINK